MNELANGAVKVAEEVMENVVDVTVEVKKPSMLKKVLEIGGGTVAALGAGYGLYKGVKGLITWAKKRKEDRMFTVIKNDVEEMTDGEMTVEEEKED